MRAHRLAFLAAVAALAAPTTASAQQAQPVRAISVVGEARSFADNDIGTFRFSVTVRRKTAAQALRSTSATVQRVIGAVRASGVRREDVQTDVVNVRRTTSRRRGTTWIAGNSVSVTVRNLDDSGTVVDRAIRAGATSVDGPELGVADIAEVYRRTLANAYADAKAKAERLAATTGLQLGAPIRIRESGADDGLFDATEQSGGGSARLTSPTSGAPVERGRASISAAISVTFAVTGP